MMNGTVLRVRATASILAALAGPWRAGTTPAPIVPDLLSQHIAALTEQAF